MNINTHTYILALISGLSLLCVSPSHAYAAESASYTLYDDVSDIVDGSPLGSHSFSLDEAGETWIAYPLTGSTFQIVTAPPAQSSSSDASSSSSTSSSDDTGGGGSGGHRGAGTNTQIPRPVSSTPTTSPKPSAPDKGTPPIPAEPDPVVTPDPLPDVDFVKDTEEDMPVHATNDTRYERITYRPHYFDYIEGATEQCFCEQVRASAPTIALVQRPAVISLLLLLSFILGYIARIARPGYTAVPQKTPKPKKK